MLDPAVFQKFLAVIDREHHTVLTKMLHVFSERAS
jgi:hypothetical protein